jgi:hypothetical protein
MRGRELKERGVGLLEGGLWLVGLLPLSLVGLSVVGVVHDWNLISTVPSAVLRETPTPGLRWLPDGRGGRFEADVEKLRGLVAQVAQRALVEAQHGVMKADSVSAKACFWIFSVNPSTGILESPIGSECDARGPMGSALSMESELEHERSNARGIVVGDGEAFVDKVVITGVIVGAEATRLLDPRDTYRFSKSAFAFARQEVML